MLGALIWLYAFFTLAGPPAEPLGFVEPLPTHPPLVLPEGPEVLPDGQPIFASWE